MEKLDGVKCNLKVEMNLTDKINEIVDWINGMEGNKLPERHLCLCAGKGCEYCMDANPALEDK